MLVHAGITALLVLSNVCLTNGDAGFPSEVEQQYIVRLHNYYRRKVVPPAADMQALSWSPQLAHMADNLVLKCNFTLPNVKEIPEFWGTGVNMAYFPKQYGDLWKFAIPYWLDHGTNFDMPTRTCIRQPCTSYRVGVWAGAHNIGCSANWCPSILHGMEGYFAACLYEPKLEGQPRTSQYMPVSTGCQPRVTGVITPCRSPVLPRQLVSAAASHYGSVHPGHACSRYPTPQANSPSFLSSSTAHPSVIVFGAVVLITFTPLLLLLLLLLVILIINFTRKLS
ncbi:unnamed protein product [Schistocephalus solidus]|uniref:SCP domain-containing protein n=1 Tax=Schistocephalus solidus TaxID=70667 RepID=A0A183SMJ4_SCHSO|nr:unnamed protein product [Schistocephalus solidus]